MAHVNNHRNRHLWLVVVILALILAHATNACIVSSSDSTVSYTVSSSMKQQYGQPDGTDPSTGTENGGGGDDPMPEIPYPPGGEMPPVPPPGFIYQDPLYDIITSGRQAEILLSVSQEYVLCPGTENDMTCLSVWLVENSIPYPEESPQPPETTSIAVEPMPMPMPPIDGVYPNHPGHYNDSLVNGTTNSSGGPGQSEPGYPGTGPDGKPEPWEQYSDQPYPDESPYPPPPPPPPCFSYGFETILKGGIQGLTFEPGYFYVLNVSAQMAGTDSNDPHQSLFFVTHYYYYYYYFDDGSYTEPNYGQTEPGYAGEGYVEGGAAVERHLSKSSNRQMPGCTNDYPVMYSGAAPPAEARQVPVPGRLTRRNHGSLAATSFMMRQNSNGGSDERPSEQPPMPPPGVSEVPGKPGVDMDFVEVPVEIKLISIVSKDELIAMPVGDSPKPDEPQDSDGSKPGDSPNQGEVEEEEEEEEGEEQEQPSPTTELQDGAGAGLGASDTTSSSGLSTGAIVGIAVGCVALSAIVLAGAVMIIRKRRQTEHEPVDTPSV